MRKLFSAVLFTLLLTYTATAQLELNVGLNGTLTSFRGPGAAPAAVIYSWSGSNTLESTSGGFYGTKKGIGWGLDFSLQKATKKSGLLGGISLGYERLISRIRSVAGIPGRTINPDTTGTTLRLVHGFINFFPYLGKRFRLSKGKGMIDIDLGMEIGLPISAALKGEGGSAHQKKPELDFRPRLQVKYQYNSLGIMLGYSLGVWNYYGLANGGKYQAYSNVGRLGIFYQLPAKSR